MNSLELIYRKFDFINAAKIDENLVFLYQNYSKSLVEVLYSVQSAFFS
jgi:hypothetical protein